MTARHTWPATPAARDRRSGAPGPVVPPVVGWWFVTWRARVLESAGSVESSLALVATALERLAMVGGVAGLHLVGPSTVVFEFWFEAGSAREACGGARSALRQALRAAGVGDPIPPPAASGLLLMLEELPTLRADDS